MFDKKVEQASHRHNCHATSLSHKRRITLEFRMFQFVRFFAVGLFLQVPMRSLGIKCYYNNNGLVFLQLLFDLKHKTLSLVPSGETRDEPPVECQEETPLDKPYCLWMIEGGSEDNLLDCRLTSHPNIRPEAWQVSATLSWVRAGWPTGGPR